MPFQSAPGTALTESRSGQVITSEVMNCEDLGNGVATIANLRQRAAAGLLDGLWLGTGAVSALCLGLDRHKLEGWMSLINPQTEPFSFGLWWVPLMLFLTVYFVGAEWLFGATPGKLLCGLRVKSLGKSRCEFVGALVRFALLPLDVATGLALLTIRPGQRFGDRIGNTTVVLHFHLSAPVNPDLPVATWEERLRAAIVDLALLGTLSIVYLWASKWLVRGDTVTLERAVILWGLPMLAVLWYSILCEGLFQATAGEVLSGLKMIPLEASSPFCPATIRAVCDPVNLATLGLVSLLLLRYTRRAQSLADWCAASAVVCRRPDNRR